MEFSKATRSLAQAAVKQQIEDEGLLSRMRLIVFEVLFTAGPLTASEVAQKLMAGGAHVGGGRSGPGNVGARITELCDLGVVRQTGQRACRATGRDVAEWDITGELPAGRVASATGPVRPPPEVMAQAAVDLHRLLIELTETRGATFTSRTAALEALDSWLMAKFVRGGDRPASVPPAFSLDGI